MSTRTEPADEFSALRTLARIGAAFTLLGGSILLVADVWGQAIETLGRTSSGMPTTPEHIVSALMLYGGIALVPGLLGVYLLQSSRAGRFGLAAFLVALVATASMVGSDWTEFFLTPTLASLAPHLKDHLPTLVRVGFMINFAAYAIGWLMFGASIIRARVFPRVSGIALIVGLLLFPVQHHAGPIIWEIAIISLGIAALRAERQEATEVAALAA